ncbi:MAG: nitroreductase family protein [Anaerolineae bacterium]|nr:nitroreductase family protein [Anaerolineae bacterium]
MNVSDLFAIIQSRRSIRQYQARPVSNNVLRRILDAARWAPSAHNVQPWRFAVVAGSEWRERLAVAMSEHLRADLAADGLPAGRIEQHVERAYRRVVDAPVVIMLCLSMADMPQYDEDHLQHAEWIMGVQSVAAAVQNLLLAAHVEGLGVCWRCAPLYCPDEIRDVLSLPEDWEVQGMLTLGYPAEEGASDRQSLEAKVLWY